MNSEVALYTFVMINALTSFGTLATVVYLLKKQKTSEKIDSAPQDKVEENLTTRLHDLQMRQFSLKVPNYRIPSRLNKDYLNKDKK